jgi:Na+-translocating ferredoxin:NAD+ oxidoreductase subunit E
MDTSTKSLNYDLIATLAVCPLLAKSASLLTALNMALALLIVLICSVLTVSVCRRYIPKNVSLAVILFISVTWVSVLDLLLQAYWFEMSKVLGLYIPLLAMNSFVLLSLQKTALQKSPLNALKATLNYGIAIFVIVVLVGSLRELFGQGSLLSDSQVFLDKDYSFLTISESGFSLILSAPGALIILGLVLALLKKLESRRAIKATRGIAVE